VQPFLRWPGGKRWFVAEHSHLLPPSYARYIEPFLGSGSLYFHLVPSRAILADTNDDLIDVYRGIKANWELVSAKLRAHSRSHSRTHYLRTRKAKPRSISGRAARLIYLNRTCFNGIYRVNRDGAFNVPMGDRNTVLHASDDFEAVARRLRRATLLTSDFEPVIDQAKRRDFVFADPPYTVAHENNGFKRYNETLFSWQDQQRLALALQRAVARGVHVVATNANHTLLRKLYRDVGFNCETLTRDSAIAASARHRAAFRELLMRSDQRGKRSNDR
jgi:DNA adenine methylase